MGRAFKTLAKQAFFSLSPDGERAGDRGKNDLDTVLP